MTFVLKTEQKGLNIVELSQEKFSNIYNVYTLESYDGITYRIDKAYHTADISKANATYKRYLRTL